MPRRLDVEIAALLLVVSQVEVWRFGVAGGGLIAAACLAGVAAISAWRTRFPLTSAAALFAPALVCAVYASPPGSATFAIAVLLAFYRLGTLPDRRRAAIALLASLLVGAAMTDDRSLNTYLAIVMTSFVAPWLAGTLRLRQQRARQLEREREHAVEAERARLARELHDLVSHNVGMIVVQAGAGDVLLDREPDRTRDALHAIEAGARDALVELRRLVGLLRSTDEAELAPQPSLARLDELVARVRAAGLVVSVRVEGEPSGLDPAVDLSAYRIVQEALTNVLKHARATRAEISLRRRDDSLEVEVADDGRGGSSTGTAGHGLVGIAERVALLGGELEMGPRPEGGFLVRARLPAT